MRKIGLFLLVLSTPALAREIRPPAVACDAEEIPAIVTAGTLMPRGASDRATDITAAAASAGERGAVVLYPGRYVVDTQPNVYGTGLAGLGARFSGKAGLPGVTDRTALFNSPFFQSKLMIVQGNTAIGSANENVSYVSAYINPTKAAAGYQKNVRYTTLIHADPSVYTTPGNGRRAAGLVIGKDGVGDDVQVSLAKGNMAGRIFARDSISQYPAGTDGAGTVQELKSINNASSQRWYGTSTSKHLLNLFADGKGYHTSGLWLDLAQSGEGGFYDAIMITGQSVVDNALMYRQTTATDTPVLAQITKAGQGRFAAGLGVGNMTPASQTLGKLIGKMPVFDMNGKPLGIVPVYAN